LSTNQTITQLPTAAALTGAELVPIVQDGGTVKTTVANIAATPALTGYSFLTATSEAGLTSSRQLTTTGGGITVTDNGAGSTLAISLTGAPASLVASGTGIQVKTGATTLTGRSIQAGTVGLSIADGDGIAGNPTVSLTGMPLYLAQSSGVGLLTRTSGNSVGVVTLQGTANEIDVANGTGDSANPTVGLADNAVLPGTQGVVVPTGTTGQRSGSPTNGVIRYNTTSQTFEGYANSAWRDFSLTGGVTSFSAGSTGLTPGTATTGAITLNGILIGANGGTGVANTGKTITLGGSLTLSGAHNLTLTQTGATSVTLPTTGTLATLAGSETLTNKTISGSNNTLSNIANASLTNSSITINGSSVSLGGSVTVTATASNALTIGTGLSGTSYNGSTPVTIAISNTGVSAATYGSASIVPVIAVNAQGQITSATDTAIAIAASQVTSGTLAVAQGGTNLASYTAGDLLYASATTTLSKLALGTQGYVLRAGATAPEWAAVDGGIFT
jgi:trimeric autotransporter adhesin